MSATPKTDRRGFAADLVAAVEESLDEATLKRAHRRLHTKAAVICAWYIASYGAILVAQGWVQGVVACTSLAFAIAGVGFNIQHDANHNAFFATGGSKRLTVANRIAGWSMYAVGASATRWIDGHVYTHHASTNIVGRDYDIELNPFGRLAPQQQHHAWHRTQHYYLWFVYAFTAASIIIADVISTVMESFTGDRTGKKPGVKTYTTLLATKAAFLVVMLGVPLLFHPLWVVAVGATYTTGVLGLLLGIVFQLAHAVEQAEFCDETNRPDMRWHEWQIRSTVDFCQKPGVVANVLTWYVGGLNYQTEHHLFPQVPHTAYPAIAPVVRDVCSRYDVPVCVQADLRTALGSHYRHLRTMAKP